MTAMFFFFDVIASSMVSVAMMNLGYGILREPRHFFAHHQTGRRGVCPATATMGLAGRQPLLFVLVASFACSHPHT